MTNMSNVNISDNTDAVSVSSSTRREIERAFSFERERQVGPWRDVVVVDILTINGQEFKGTIRPREAKDAIYKASLGLAVDNLHGVRVEYRGHPVVSFRLREQINVDTEFTSDRICYNRCSGSVTDKIEGRIRGIRMEASPDGTSSSTRKKIKIKNCNWGLKEEQIVEWMNKFGKIEIPLTEEVADMSNGGKDDDDEDDVEFGNGDYWLTMELTNSIPQFLLMWGKKIEIYYRGMEQLCLRCYRPGHKRADCVSEKREWMDYVVEFIANYNFKPESYGKWAQIAKSHKRNTRENNPHKGHEPVPPPEITLKEQSTPNLLTEKQSQPKVPESVVTAQEINIAPEAVPMSEKEMLESEQIENETSEQSAPEEWKTASYRNSSNYRTNTQKSYAETTAAQGSKQTYTVEQPTNRRSSRRSSLAGKVIN